MKQPLPDTSRRAPCKLLLDIDHVLATAAYTCGLPH